MKPFDFVAKQLRVIIIDMKILQKLVMYFDICDAPLNGGQIMGKRALFLVSEPCLYTWVVQISKAHLRDALFLQMDTQKKPDLE